MRDELVTPPDEYVEVLPNGYLHIRKRDEQVEHLEQIIARQRRVLLYIVDRGRHDVGWLSGNCLETCAVCAAAKALGLAVRDLKQQEGGA